MAMTICKNCGKSISDKAKACPECGCESVPNEDNKVIICRECSSAFSSDLESCPVCGCPASFVPATEEDYNEGKDVNTNVKANSKKKVIAIIAVVVSIVLIAIASVGIKIIIDKKAEEEAVRKHNEAVQQYEASLNTVASYILSGTSDAESVGNLTYNVWHNCIYEEWDEETDKYTTKEKKKYGSFYDDFNHALSNLFADESYKTKISKIKTNQKQVQILMKELQNPPEGCSESYEAAKNLYYAYLDLTNIVIDPSGSLRTYSEKLNAAVSDVVNGYKAIQLYL